MNTQKPRPAGRKNRIKWFVICLLFIVCLFLLWPGVTTEEIDIFVPIEFEHIPSGLSIARTPLKGIEIKVRGPKTAIKTLAKLKYRFELSGLKSGIQQLPIEKDRIRLPKGVVIISITPSYLTLKIENETKKTLPVEISFSGPPPKGFLIANAAAKPPEVTLCGPESILAPVKQVQTKPVDLNGRFESFKKEITLDLKENLKIISSAETFSAEVSIAEIIATKIFNNIPVAGRETRHPYRITPAAISIEVKGPINTLEKLDTEKSIQVYVDLKGLTPGVYVRRAVIALPVNTTLVASKPEVFTATVNDR